MAGTKLSILITYYNEGVGLAETLKSLVIPPELELEILIFDDASKVVPGPYIPADKAAEVIRSESNVGPAVGRNRLLQSATGDYIHFHDADDLFDPEWAIRILQEIEDGEPDVIFTEIGVKSQGEWVSEGVQGLQPLTGTEALVRFCIRHAILTSAGVYRAGAVRKIGGYRESLWQSEDYDFHIRLAASGVSYRMILEPLVIRVSEAGRSAEKLEVWDCALKAVELLSQELPLEFRADLAEAAARMSSILFRLGARSRARQGFKLASSLGLVEFKHQQRMYQWVAKKMGPEYAEWLGAGYRKLLPKTLRKKVRD